MKIIDLLLLIWPTIAKIIDFIVGRKEQKPIKPPKPTIQDVGDIVLEADSVSNLLDGFHDLNINKPAAAGKDDSSK